jgi:hypothetical protein
MVTKTGKFVLSLDFELMWGVRDHRTIGDYGANVLGVRQVVPTLLRLFTERRVGCTWATVGLLFFANKRKLVDGLPDLKPAYADARLSPYEEIAKIGDNEETDPYWYGRSLISRILDCPGQEVGTHTFSHFYCLEPGGTPEMLRADLVAANHAAASMGVDFKSVVFPRNQISGPHLVVCREVGLRAFRGNEQVWFHDGRSRREQTQLHRAFRLVHAYIPVGRGEVDSSPIIEGMVNIRASRFLRPFRNGRIFENMRLRTITRAMTAAAQLGTTYHLWWHPHNFGINLDENVSFLRDVLDHLRVLQDEYGMVSLTMRQATEEMLQCIP